MKFSICIVLIFLNSLAAFSQVSQQWVKRYNGPAGGFDIAREMLLKPDGSIIVIGNSVGIGTSSDIVIIKYSPAGDEQWVSRYNYPADRSDNVSSAVLDDLGYIFITGFITDSTDVTRMAVLRFDSAGIFQWIRTFDSTAYTQSYGESIAVSGDGNIFVTGTARSISSLNDFVTMKFSLSGELLWRKTYNGLGNGDDSSVGLVLDDQNNAFVTGSSKTTGTASDIVTLKYNNSGDLLFTKTFSGPSDLDDRPTSVTTDQNNNIIIAGVTSGSNGFDYLTLKYSNQGNLLWSKTYDGTGNSIDYTYKVITDAEDNIYVTGSSRSGTLLGTEDAVTIKYDSAGAVKWTNRFDGQASGSDIGYCLTVDSKQNVYIGCATDRGGIQLILGTLKLNSSGKMEWLQTYNFYSAPEDFPYRILVDDLDNVYLCGISFGGTTDYDIATIKYSQSIGISQIGNSLPEKFELFQNYPNPFNPSTKISFDLPQSSYTTLAIHNSIGQEITVLIDRDLQPGKYKFTFDASSLPSGIYFYTLSSAGFRKTGKMMLIR